MAPVLHLVATPIGNLEDFTFRALRVLKEVSLVAAEDTRRTKHLLDHYGISTRVISLHAHNEAARIPLLLGHLEQGDAVALVTDAGTPGVSDPGSSVVQAAREAGYRVEAIPGASAVLTALAVSGFPASDFTFLGFPPTRAKDRNLWFERLGRSEGTTVFFEAPHRIRRTLTELLEKAGNRVVSVCRELTKIHEEVIVGHLTDIAARIGEPRGEFTIVLAPHVAQDADERLDLPEAANLLSRFNNLMETGLSRRSAISALAREFRQPARAIYGAIEAAKNSGEQPKIARENDSADPVSGPTHVSRQQRAHA